MPNGDKQPFIDLLKASPSELRAKQAIFTEEMISRMEEPPAPLRITNPILLDVLQKERNKLDKESRALTNTIEALLDERDNVELRLAAIEQFLTGVK